MHEWFLEVVYCALMILFRLPHYVYVIYRNSMTILRRLQCGWLTHVNSWIICGSTVEKRYDSFLALSSSHRVTVTLSELDDLYMSREKDCRQVTKRCSCDLTNLLLTVAQGMDVTELRWEVSWVTFVLESVRALSSISLDRFEMPSTRVQHRWTFYLVFFCSYV